MARESLGTESGKSWGGGEEKFVWIPESKLSMHNDVVSWSELPLQKILFPIAKVTILHLQGNKYPGVRNVKSLNKLYPCKNRVTTVLDEGEPSAGSGTDAISTSGVRRAGLHSFLMLLHYNHDVWPNDR